jgi:hypothetical protein
VHQLLPSRRLRGRRRRRRGSKGRRATMEVKLMELHRSSC